MELEQKPKQDIWQEHISNWRRSTLSQKEYCQRNDISFSSFGYWRGRLNRLAKPRNKLIPVAVSQPAPVIAVFLPGGLRLDVPSHVLADVLPVVCRTIQ